MTQPVMLTLEAIVAVGQEFLAAIIMHPLPVRAGWRRPCTVVSLCQGNIGTPNLPLLERAGINTVCYPALPLATLRLFLLICVLLLLHWT